MCIIEVHLLYHTRTYSSLTFEEVLQTSTLGITRRKVKNGNGVRTYTTLAVLTQDGHFNLELSVL